MIAGSFQELYDWFGYWPGFHDAEVLKLRLSIGEPSSLVVHTWEMTNKVTAQGFYELTKHIVVEFALEGISNVNVGDLWEGSILLDLGIQKTERGFRLDLSAAYGFIWNHRVPRAVSTPYSRKSPPYFLMKP